MIRIIYPYELAHSNYIAVDPSNSLWHYGRPGMKWYQHIYGDHLEKSTARAQRRISNRDNKIKYTKANGIDASKAYKLKAEQSKYQDKLYKLEAKNRRTKVRLMKGKDVGLIRRHNLLQEQRVRSKKAKLDLKLNQPESKIKELEYNNRRDEERIAKNNKRLDRLNNRIDKNFVRKVNNLNNAFNRADERATIAAKNEMAARKYGLDSKEWKKADKKFRKAVSKQDTILNKQAKIHRDMKRVFDNESNRKPISKKRR